MKFRRKSRATEPVEGADAEQAPDATAEAPGPTPATGPFDESDVRGDGVMRIDLGAVLIEPEPGREVRLEVGEQGDGVRGVFLAGQDGALEIRAFAAPRNGDLWTTVRPQLAADMARRGGTATEREGRFGTELICRLTVNTEKGPAQQPSRIIGINGPRWLLRCTLIGRPAIDPDSSGAWEDTIARLVVRRGEHALPVGDPLPFTVPPGMRDADVQEAIAAGELLEDDDPQDDEPRA